MTKARYLLTLLAVLVAAAATVAMAAAMAGTGAPLWQALAGPALLVLAMVLRLRRRRP